MFEFNHTLLGIAQFNNVKNSEETRNALHVESIDEWYDEQLLHLTEQMPGGIRFVTILSDYVTMKSITFPAKEMHTDDRYGICDDRDIRCIRIFRHNRHDRPVNAVYKKRAWYFMDELLHDYMSDLPEIHHNYICTRFAVEWMEQRIRHFGMESIVLPVNDGVASQEAMDYASGSVTTREQCESLISSSETMAEILVISGGVMPAARTTGETVPVPSDMPTYEQLLTVMRQFPTEILRMAVSEITVERN